MYIVYYEAKKMDFEEAEYTGVRSFDDLEDAANFVAAQTTTASYGFKFMGLNKTDYVSIDEMNQFDNIVETAKAKAFSQQCYRVAVNQDCATAGELETKLYRKKEELDKYLTDFTAKARNLRIKEIEELQEQYWNTIRKIQENFKLLTTVNRSQIDKNFWGLKVSKYLDLKIPE